MYEKELVKLVFPREKRITIYELAQNTAYSPNIYFFSIDSPNQKFRRPIPSCCHIVSESLSPFFYLPREAKIANLEAMIPAY